MSREWTPFYEEFQTIVRCQCAQFIKTGEDVKFTPPGDFVKFSEDYFNFCSIAYPKSPFENNYLHFITKFPIKYAKCLMINVPASRSELEQDAPTIAKFIIDEHARAADDYLNRVLQNNLAQLIHPAPPQHQQVGNAISSASSFAPRRPTRSNRSEHLPASPVSLSQPAPQQIVAAPNSHQRAPANSQPPVHNRINELVSSTPIFRRSNARERAPNNLQDQLQAASSKLHNQIVVDQQVDQHLQSEIPAGFSGGTQPNPVVVHQRAPVSKTVVF